MKSKQGVNVTFIKADGFRVIIDEGFICGRLELDGRCLGCLQSMDCIAIKRNLEFEFKEELTKLTKFGDRLS